MRLSSLLQPARVSATRPPGCAVERQPYRFPTTELAEAFEGNMDVSHYLKYPHFMALVTKKGSGAEDETFYYLYSADTHRVCAQVRVVRWETLERERDEWRDGSRCASTALWMDRPDGPFVGDTPAEEDDGAYLARLRAEWSKLEAERELAEPEEARRCSSERVYAPGAQLIRRRALGLH